MRVERLARASDGSMAPALPFCPGHEYRQDEGE